MTLPFFPFSSPDITRTVSFFFMSNPTFPSLCNPYITSGASETIFINSLSEPFEENDIEDEIKNKWLNYFNLPRYQAHASGHCSKEEIFDVLRKAKPKRVFPVHTEHPEMFKEAFKKVTLPKKERTYSL